MRKALQRTATVFAALLLCLSAILGLTTAQAGGTATDPLDFGISDMKTNQALTASELFGRLFDEALTTNEVAYLDGLSGISFVYNDAIPDSIVTTKYNGDNGTLRITLPSYRYVATNGTAVEWTPIKATIGSKSGTFTSSSDKYVCELDGLFYSGDFDVQIDFSWSATVPSTSVDRLLTATYTNAEIALKEIREYESTLAAFNEAKAKYQAYEAYLEAAEAYRQYAEVDKPAYDQAYAEYLTLKAKYDQYLERLAAFEAWEQYWAYQEFMSDDVQLRYLAYQQYLRELAPIKAKLGILEALFVSDSHGWQLYASLMGNTVTTVVNRKQELVLAGCSESDINQAGDSTVELRRLMGGFKDLRAAEYDSEHEYLKALYAYYTVNYHALTQQFDKLYSALKRLSDNAAVITEMSRRGKLEHFRQFIGQLYYTQAALDDNETVNSSTVVAGGVTVGSAVEACQQLTDSNTASPSGVTMPENEVPKVEKVEQIDRPPFDEVHDKPTLADFGLSKIPVEPDKPDVVTKPDTVDPAPPPGSEPSAPDLDERLRAVAEDLRAGKLPRRQAVGKDMTLTLSKSIECSISISNLKTVSFYSADSKTLLDRQTLEYGASFRYGGTVDVQNRPSDERSHYRFLGWVLSDGTAPTEFRATSNLSLYANYHETPRFYQVTWVLDGRTEVQNLAYGVTPTPPFATVKEETAAATYTFSGWDKPIVPVTGDVTYTASFLATPRTYTVTWIAGDVTKTQTLAYGELPSFDTTPTKAPDGSLYSFLRWDREIQPVRSDVTYTALFTETVLAFNEYNEQLSVEHGETALTVTATTKRADVREVAILAQASNRSLCIMWSGFSLTLTPDQLPALIASSAREIGILEQTGTNGSTVYRLGYLNSAGAAEPLALTATLEILTNDAGGQLVGYLETDGIWNRLDTATVTVTGEARFRISDVHRLTVTANEPVNLKKLPRFIESGSTVSLSLIGCEFGYELTSAMLVFADGTRQPLTGDSFVMPNAAVSLELTLQKIVYRVIFKVDGNVISSAEYGSGEEILLPEAPVKPDDELYTYTFSGWSPEVPAIAYGDEREWVFEAVFSKKLIDPSSFDPDRSAFYLFLGIASGALVLLIAATVLLIVLLRRRKARRMAGAAASKAVQKELPAVMQQNPPPASAEESSVASEPLQVPKACPPDHADEADSDSAAENTDGTDEQA